MADRAAELEAVIADDPDDPAPYLVYADWLQAREDPRGALIVLQHHGRQDEARALIDAHRAHFLGPLATFVPDGDAAPARERRKLELGWHLGFLREVRIGWGPGGFSTSHLEAVEAVRVLRELLALPSMRFLRHLAIESVPGDPVPDFAPFLDELAGAARPPPLRSLFVGRSGGESSWIGPIAGVLRAYPALRHLTLRAGALAIGELRHAELRAFGIESCQLTAESLADLRAAAWPRLERLEISFHDRTRPPACAARDLAPLLEGDHLPSLSHLGVRCCAFADDVARALARSMLLRRLSSLDLAGGALSDAGVAAMARARLAFSHLEHLELDRNRLTAAGRRAARRLAKRVSLGSQDPPEPPAAA
jgi:uncharacterized protein (TIGR02996 family)